MSKTPYRYANGWRWWPVVLSALLIPWQLPTAQAGQAMEEVVVTGSYIRRDSFDSASPITTIDAIEINDRATPVLGEVLRNMPSQYNIDTITQILSTRPQEGNSQGANLRGLGANATLQLVDGRRTAIANVNQFYPQIAIERIEFLKDGAAALYGSDAVAGVVNYIPRKHFEGLEVQGLFQAMEDSGWEEKGWSIIGGASNDTTSMVAALEYVTRDLLKQRDIPKYTTCVQFECFNAAAALTISSHGNPGRWTVPDRDATGALDGTTTTMRDPGCGLGASSGDFSLNQSKPGNNRSGIPAGSTCFFNFGEFFDFVSEQEKWNFFAHLEHQFTDAVTFDAQVVFSRQEIDSRGSPTNSSGRFADTNALIGALVGEHPGNPFTAMADRGAGLEPLYAADTNANGIPDRDCDGDLVFDPGSEGNPNCTVILNPIDPFVQSPGTIPFNEDVLVSQFRIYGKATRGRPSTVDGTGAGEGNETNTRNSYRWSGGFVFDIPFKNWTGDVHYTWHKFEDNSFGNNNVFSNIVRGLTVDVDEATGAVTCGLQPSSSQPDLTGCYNPFWTSQHPCVNRTCDYSQITPETSAAFNTNFVHDQLTVAEQTITDFTINIVDAVFTGDVVELPAGALGLALGAQWRDEKLDVDDSDLANACDLWRNPCGFDFSPSRTLWGGFFEVMVPLVSNETFGTAELQAAGRYSNFDNDLDSFDPKFALLWHPRDWLALRASWSTSFRSPSLTNMFAPPISFQQSVSLNQDYLDPTFEAFVVNTFEGNPDLNAEEATVWNVGFTLNLLEGDLSIGADYVNIEYDDRLANTDARDVLRQQFPVFGDWFNTNNVGTTYPTCSLNATGGMVCTDPLERQGAVGDWLASGLERDVRRDNLGSIQEVFTATENALKSEFHGIDLAVGYSFDAEQIPWIGGDWGSFRVSTDWSYITRYEFQLTQFDPLRNVEGARNDFTGTLGPMPKWGGTGRVSWFMGDHAVTTFVRFIGDVNQDGGNCFTSAGVLRDSCDGKIESLTTLDLNYTLTKNNLFGGDRTTTFQLGAKNVFDNTPDAFRTIGGGLETLLHDPRGRMWFARMTQEI